MHTHILNAFWGSWATKAHQGLDATHLPLKTTGDASQSHVAYLVTSPNHCSTLQDFW